MVVVVVVVMVFFLYFCGRFNPFNRRARQLTSLFKSFDLVLSFCSRAFACVHPFQARLEPTHVRVGEMPNLLQNGGGEEGYVSTPPRLQHSKAESRLLSWPLQLNTWPKNFGHPRLKMPTICSQSKQ